MELGADWVYSTNAGIFGNTTAQSSLISDADVGNILLADNFKGNDGVGGSRGVAVSTVDLPMLSLQVPLTEGTYSLVVTGIIKGHNYVYDQPFSLTVSVATVTNNSCNHL